MPAASKPTAGPIGDAAKWLADTPRAQRGGAIVPQIQIRFGLSLQEAVAIVRQNNLRLARSA